MTLEEILIMSEQYYYFHKFWNISFDVVSGMNIRPAYKNGLEKKQLVKRIRLYVSAEKKNVFVCLNELKMPC
jgi:hypothetical protein